LCVFACLMGVVALSLFVASMTNMTDFSPKENLVYEAITTDRALKEELRTDAAVIVKDFLVLTRLRKRQLEKKRRTQLLMGLIAHAHRFHIKRQCV
jgi:hypothetical protein